MTERPQNLLHALPGELPQELIEPLLTAGPVRIERIVSHGHASPPDFWYEQAEHEWVLLVAGAARLQFEDHTLELAPGDWVDIPAHVRHRVVWTSPTEPTVWLAVFFPPDADPPASP